MISCRHLQQVGEERNHNYPDAVYKIYPTGSQPVMAYCDMSRDGGGWTLLVTSHTNSWTAQNVKLRNANSPKLTDDYSILQYADSIKDNIKVAGSTFEYRLEAQSRGNSLYQGSLFPFKRAEQGLLAKRVSVAAITKCGQHESQKSCVFFFKSPDNYFNKNIAGESTNKEKTIARNAIACSFFYLLINRFFKLNIEEHNYCRVHQHGGYYIAKIFITHTKLFSGRAHRILAKYS